MIRAVYAEIIFSSDPEKAYSIFFDLSATSNHGLVLLHIKEKAEKLFADDPDNRTAERLAKLAGAKLGAELLDDEEEEQTDEEKEEKQAPAEDDSGDDSEEGDSND